MSIPETTAMYGEPTMPATNTAQVWVSILQHQCGARTWRFGRNAPDFCEGCRFSTKLNEWTAVVVSVPPTFRRTVRDAGW